MIFNKAALLLPAKAVVSVIAMCAMFASASGQEVISMGGTKEGNIIALPLSYNTDKGFTDVGAVKTERYTKKKKAKEDNYAFKPQMESIAAQTAAKGGNAFQITRMEDLKQKGHYMIWAEAYKTNNESELAQWISDNTKKKFAGEPCAYITIYRPAYTQGFNDSVVYDIVINDTLRLEMKSNCKYLLKVTRPGNVKIAVKHKNFTQDMTVSVAMGKDYYVRNYTNFPGSRKYIATGDYKVKVRGYTPYLDKIDDYQGRIESSMVTQIIITKRI